LNTKPREKPFLVICWHVLKLREKPSYSGLLTADETWVPHFEPEPKSIHGMTPFSFSLGGGVPMGKVIISLLGL
jgi:hypothetical protein